MAEEYYQILEVPRSASADEIQKAYRKLARKYHPDLHADKSDTEKDQAKQKFQQIQTAYDVLNDPKKREMYDRFGENFDMPGGEPAPSPAGNLRSGIWTSISARFLAPEDPAAVEKILAVLKICFDILAVRRRHPPRAMMSNRRSPFRFTQQSEEVNTN